MERGPREHGMLDFYISERTAYKVASRKIQANERSAVENSIENDVLGLQLLKGFLNSFGIPFEMMIA